VCRRRTKLAKVGIILASCVCVLVQSAVGDGSGGRRHKSDQLDPALKPRSTDDACSRSLRQVLVAHSTALLTERSVLFIGSQWLRWHQLSSFNATADRVTRGAPFRISHELTQICVDFYVGHSSCTYCPRYSGACGPFFHPRSKFYRVT